MEKRRDEKESKGESAGKFALHFSRETVTPSGTLLRLLDAGAGEKSLVSLFVFPWPVCFAHYPSLQVVDIPLRSTFTERKQLRHGLSVYASSRLPLCKLLNASRATVFFAPEQPALFSLPGCLPL